MSLQDPAAAYEAFRVNKEYEAGEPIMPPWRDLPDTEKQAWVHSHQVYTDNGEHGDPAITQRNKPRA